MEKVHVKRSSFDLRTMYSTDRVIFSDLKDLGHKLPDPEFDRFTSEEIKTMSFDQYKTIMSRRYEELKKSGY